MRRSNVTPMISQDAISKRVGEMGRQIANDYAEKNLVLLGMLNGAYTFMADLARAVDLDFQIHFMKASSYGQGQESSGAVNISLASDCPMGGKDILIVEDIVDTGQTLSKVVGFLQGQSPASIRICSFLDKPSRRKVDITIDYIGFTIEDYFAVGYGMDVNEKYRNLPFIGAYGQEGAEPSA
ncbi:MAG: hypoxanthine phosphoribosyltransferase [Holophagales bacterium]|nr:hypoxanthine phosphoribosyltransferase [Holophagales bacterium]